MNGWPLLVLVSSILHRWTGYSSHAPLDTGAQPLVNDDGSVILAVNGEIYNHLALRKGLKESHKFKTHSDCEVIMYLVSQSRLNHGQELTPSHSPPVQGT